MTESTDAPRKETPTQRVERIKREKAPWSIMDDIRRYARDGFASIPADDLGVRFRAWGLYTQGDGPGTRGEEQPFFMMRERARRVTSMGGRRGGCARAAVSRVRGGTGAGGDGARVVRAGGGRGGAGGAGGGLSVGTPKDW